MKDILLTGNIFIATEKLIDKLDDEGRIVLCGNSDFKNITNKKVITYPYREDDNEFRGIFKSYDLDTVVYFSKLLDGHKRLYDEIEMLENVLYASRVTGVKNVIYVTTNDYIGHETTTRTKLARTCEEICRQLADETEINLILLRVPYLFSVEEIESTLTNILRKAISENVIELSGTEEKVTDFLNDEDLGELLGRIIDNPPTGYFEANVTGGNKLTLAQVAQLISGECKTVKTDYLEFTEAIPQALDDGVLREVYEWFPRIRLEDWLPDVIKGITKDKKGKRKSSSPQKKKIRELAILTIEMILLFLVAEFLTAWTENHYRMDYVDFRLLFVIIMGTIYGTGAGIIASLLAYGGYCVKDLFNNNWQIVFFNIENWLPFAAYFLSGTIVGHTRDKKQTMLQSLKEQHELLENKYVFLNELYSKTLEKKEDFSRQIVGYEDSFGRIYQVVRKLNSTETDCIFYESINAMEEIMENNSVAIYTLSEDKNYARLNVCSGEISMYLEKTLYMNNYSEVLKELSKNQIWYNVYGNVDYPAYVAPIYRNNVLLGFVALWNVEAESMKMDYLNRFTIMSGLIQDAMVRAIEYNESMEHKRMIEGTRFLKAEYFEEIIALKEQQDKDGMSEYILKQILAENMTEKQISDAVSNSLRSTDILGKREDGRLYVLLNQTSEENLNIITTRLEPKGIFFKRV